MHNEVTVIGRDKEPVWFVTVDCSKWGWETSWRAPALHYCFRQFVWFKLVYFSNGERNSFFCFFLSFQNHHELQPEGDPASSVRSEPTPTLHVSKYSIFDKHVSCAFKTPLLIWCALADGWAKRGHRWKARRAEDDAVDRDWLWGNCGAAITVATVARLKRDIHYLPWIIGFQSAPALCASAEQHAEDALPFSLRSPNGQFEGRAAQSRAKNKVISLTKADVSSCITACYSPISAE